MLMGRSLLALLAGCLLPLLPCHTLFADMKALAEKLTSHVTVLSEEIGERNAIRYGALERAGAYIEKTFRQMGYVPESQFYELEGRAYRNIYVTLRGNRSPEEFVVVGAHYDTVPGTPGADDNASGVAGLLELASGVAGGTPGRTVRFIAFTNEEPPYFRSRKMGSRVYARAARERGEKITAMLCLEMIGYFSDEKGSQSYPLPFMGLAYPDAANFISVVGNLRSRSLVKRVGKGLKRQSGVGVESLATFTFVPGLDFSDHYSFYKEGYPAVMITDTAFYRNSHYHMASDRAATLDYRAMAHVVEGLRHCVLDLAE
jgi:Zn-dependent M28 family amino/carboxypeptidase